MEKVLKNEFATIFKQMTTEFSRLYPKIFNEEKNKKLNRYLKMNRDSHSFKENAKKIHEQLVKYKQDFDIKNIDILKDIVLFDSLIDFKVFENETEKTKKIILEYIIQYYQCFSLAILETNEDIQEFFKQIDKEEYTDLLERLSNNSTIKELISDVQAEMQKNNLTEMELLQNLTSGKRNKKTMQMVKKLGGKFHSKLQNDKQLKQDLEPILEKVKDFVNINDFIQK